MKVRIKINMKNGDKHKVILSEIEEGISVVKLLQFEIFKNYSKKSDLNINCFELDNEERTSVAIMLEDISSIEYGYKAVE